jgi:hypothetical protein
VAPVAPSKVIVETDADAVASAVCARLESAAAKAIADRGHFVCTRWLNAWTRKSVLS